MNRLFIIVADKNCGSDYCGDCIKTKFCCFNGCSGLLNRMKISSSKNCFICGDDISIGTSMFKCNASNCGSGYMCQYCYSLEFSMKRFVKFDKNCVGSIWKIEKSGVYDGRRIINGNKVGLEIKAVTKLYWQNFQSGCRLESGIFQYIGPFEMNCAKGERYKHDLPNFQFYTQRWPLDREEPDWDTSVSLTRTGQRFQLQRCKIIPSKVKTNNLPPRLQALQTRFDRDSKMISKCQE